MSSKNLKKPVNFLNFWSSFTLPKDYCCSFSDLDALKNGIFQVPWLEGRSNQNIYADIWQVEQAICHITSQIFFFPLSGDMIVDIFKVPGNASCAMHLGKAAPSLASDGDSLQAQLKLKPGNPAKPLNPL